MGDSDKDASACSLEMWQLFRTVSEARDVAIDEEQNIARHICAEGQRLEGDLREVSPQTDGIKRILTSVSEVNVRAVRVSTLLLEAKDEFDKIIRWSNATAKSEHLLQGWCSCLEQLAQGFASIRVRPRDTKQMESVEPPRPELVDIC